jgi:hypothetical protein
MNRESENRYLEMSVLSQMIHEDKRSGVKKRSEYNAAAPSTPATEVSITALREDNHSLNGDHDLSTMVTKSQLEAKLNQLNNQNQMIVEQLEDKLKSLISDSSVLPKRLVTCTHTHTHTTHHAQKSL